MRQVNSYLGFNGKCREAMEFYKQCLGGELMLTVVKDSPVAAQVPPDMQDQIIHSMLTSGPLVLMGTDMSRGKVVEGNTVSICINCSSREELTDLFTKLSEGGEVRDPLMEAFWGGYFGAITDKYGKQWVFNYDKTWQG
ncbi:MAG TPA: VOC family protein [Puia sp.]|nr:VOC family protein [Puia sp.]